jgi:LCP family protein required for cell wall assembly
VDAHSRGQADEIDPADQWVLNPQTGNYELRLNNSAQQPSAAPSAAAPRPPAPRNSQRQGQNQGQGLGQGQGPGQGQRRRGTAAPGGPRQAAGGDTQALGIPGHDAPDRDAPGRGTSGRDEPGRDVPGRDVPGQRSRRAGKGSDGTATAAAGRRKRKQSKSRAKKVLLWTGGTLALAMVATTVGGYLYYEHLNSNITAIPDDNAGTGGFSKDRAINILLIGTDKRTGAGNQGYGDKNSPGHADTTVLLHVSKDRTNATALSIPRDLKTDIPDCETTQPDGSVKTIPGTPNERFNTSLGQSGRTASCTMRTVTKITGITLDHFMVADFNAVKSLTTAVGGVPICLAKDIKDPESHLELPAGNHKIQGEDALAFLRTRYSFGNRGDLDRIQQQQQFLSSLMRTLKSDNTLTSPTKLFKLAEAGTKALTVDSRISDIGKLRDLGLELGKFEMKNLTFATVPVDDNPAEKIKATVVLKEPQAATLFSMMKSDTSLTEVKAKEQAAKARQQGLLKGTRAAAADVRVAVFNGSQKQGAALKTLEWLQNNQGVLKSSNEGNAPQNLATTTLTYAPNQADQARKLADLMGLPATALKPGTTDAVGVEPMTLTLGSDFKGAGVPITGPAKLPSDVQKVQADKSVCAK